MTTPSIIAISRAERYSPNNVGNDTAILEAVCGRLHALGYTDVMRLSEDDLQAIPQADIYITMGRHKATLDKLAGCDSIVVNSVEGIRLATNRWRQMEVFKQNGIPVAPPDGADGYWVKRGEGCAESQTDVQYVADRASAEAMAKAMEQQGHRHNVIQAHVKGDLVKFYGVKGTGFFRYYYPGDDGKWKFADEQRNGQPQHYAFSATALHETAERAAEVSLTDVYGGDAIIRSDDTFCLIDFNDWPSFSRCRDEAAEAIARLIEQRIKKRNR